MLHPPDKFDSCAHVELSGQCFFPGPKLEGGWRRGGGGQGQSNTPILGQAIPASSTFLLFVQ